MMEQLETRTSTCARCGPVTVAVPVIVDLEVVGQKPELAEAIRNGTIHQAACPACGGPLTADAPLLVHIPGPPPMLLFSPAQGTTAEQDREAGRLLVERWRRHQGVSGPEGTIEVLPVPREHLPVMLREGMAMRLHQDLGDAARDRDPLIPIGVRFMMAISWDEAYRVVREHPELLGEEGESVREALERRARLFKQQAELDAEIALLRRCQEVGIEAAFAEKLGCTADDVRQFATRSPLPIHDIMEESDRAEQIHLSTGNVGALDTVIACWERMLFPPEQGLEGDDGGEAYIKAHRRLDVWDRAGRLFLLRHQARGAAADLDRAVALRSRVLEEVPAGSPDRPGCAYNLAMGYRARYDFTGRLEDLQSAIDLYRQALDATPPTSPLWSGFLMDLGTGMRKRYERTGRVQDLEEAIVICRRAHDATVPGSPARVRCGVGLGNGLIARYHRYPGQVDDLEEAITLFRQDFNATPAGSAEWPGSLSRLGHAVHMRHERTGRMEDLDEAIALFRGAVGVLSTHLPSRWQIAAELGDCLRTRYGRTGRMNELEEAITLCREGLADVRVGSPHHGELLSGLGAGLSLRHQRLDRIEDLEEAIAVFRRLLDTSDLDDPVSPGPANDLGTCLRTRYEKTGRVEDLEEAIALFRKARAACSADSPGRGKILNNLGAALRKRYESTNRLEDLQEAIAIFRYNLDAAPPDWPGLPTILVTLGNALGTRYMRARRMEDLQEAIAVYRRALDAIPAESPDRPRCLTTLGIWLELQYESTERIEDLAEANAVRREAARLQRELDFAAGMDRGYTHPVEVSCAQCGPLIVKSWLIVDLDNIQRRPDIADAIREGTIHQVTCSGCGTLLGMLDYPLLLHCPGPEPTLVFSPAQRVTEEESQQAARALVEKWLTLSGAAATTAKPRVISIPRGLLPMVVDEGVDVAQARLAEALAPREDPVTGAVVQLLRASTEEEIYEAVRDITALADERAEALLSNFTDRVRAAGDEAVARTCEEHAKLLRRCREIGVRSACMEMLGCPSNYLDELDAVLEVPRETRENIREAERQEERFARTRSMEALDMAAACWERVLSDPGMDRAPLRARVARWNQAGAVFLGRHDARGELSDLERAITVWGQALEMLTPGSSDSHIILANLGTGLKVRHQRTGRMDDLGEAIRFFRQAIDLGSPDSPYRQSLLAGLGSSILERHERTGRMDDLEEAIMLCRRAVDVDSTNPAAVNGLVAALRRRYNVAGMLGDVEEIIATCRRARDPASADRPACLGNLGIGLSLRYERTGKAEDIEGAIEAFRRELEVTPGDSRHRSVTLSNLASALADRYQRTGRMDDLEQAIAICRSVLDVDPLNLNTLSALSGALRRRHMRSGKMEDMEECVALLRRGVAASSPGSLEHLWWLNNLGVCVYEMYDHTGRRGDLHEAVDLCRQAVEGTPPDSPDRPMFLANLGMGLNAQYCLTANMDDLQEATAVCREAVAAISAGDPERGMCLSHLGISLRLQYERTRRIADLLQAIAVHREAVEAVPVQSPSRPGYLHRLSVELHELHVRTWRIEDLEEAMAVSRQALELGLTLAPGAALYSAAMRGRWLLMRSAWQEAAAAYAEAMTLLDTLYETQLLRSDKHGWLRSARPLYAEAAYSRARSGDLQGAVLAMETGRARVLTEMLDRSRADLEAVEAQAPELVHRYRQMLAQLRRLEGMATNGGVTQASAASEHTPHLPERLREARAELHAAVEAIRATPGGASLLSRPSVDALAAALPQGVPAIYLVATSAGGLVLVVSSAAGGLEVTPLWLDSLTTAAVYELLQGSAQELKPESWLGAYREWQRHPDDRKARKAWHERIEITTRALWDIAMGPVVALLGERFPGCELAVLIPSGLLALLPLHAAWTDAEGESPRCALDHVAFSYAPSIRALAHASDIAGKCGQARLLVVDEPRPTSASPLPNSRHEIEAAAAQFARHDATRLAGEQCLRDEVLAAIVGADICHFACHGMNDWGNPLRSGLLMAHDEMLTVEALLALPGSEARLAVLSACETGIVGTDAPDEVVALPAAFLQAGFAAVVATLWSVYDISASLLMARFYELWRKERLAPAVALRRAQLWLRDLTNRDLAAHLEDVMPELAPRMSRETAEALHFRAIVQDPNRRSFAGPVHWAAFYFTGA